MSSWRTSNFKVHEIYNMSCISKSSFSLRVSNAGNLVCRFLQESMCSSTKFILSALLVGTSFIAVYARIAEQMDTRDSDPATSSGTSNGNSTI
jgi:hypothetical protein